MTIKTFDVKSIFLRRANQLLKVRCNMCGRQPAAAAQVGPIVPLNLKFYEFHDTILVTPDPARCANNAREED